MRARPAMFSDSEWNIPETVANVDIVLQIVSVALEEEIQ